MPALGKVRAGGDDEHAGQEHAARREELLCPVERVTGDDPIHRSGGRSQCEDAQDARGRRERGFGCGGIHGW